MCIACFMTNSHVWQIYMCDMTHSSHVSNSNPSITYSVDTCDMCDTTHSYMWHDSYKYVRRTKMEASHTGGHKRMEFKFENWQSEFETLLTLLVQVRSSAWITIQRCWKCCTTGIHYHPCLLFESCVCLDFKMVFWQRVRLLYLCAACAWLMNMRDMTHM